MHVAADLIVMLWLDIPGMLPVINDPVVFTHDTSGHAQ